MTIASKTAMPAFPTWSLPAELMTMVLDHTDLSSLLQLSHSCRHWRAVARAHPLFWRKICLAHLSTTALDFFHARLDQTTESDIQLEIRLPDALEHGRIRSVVLPAIARNLHRVLELVLILHYESSSYTLPFLMGEASRLHHCTLSFRHGSDKPPVQLPVNLLSGHCPNLSSMTVRNVEFPPHAIRSFGHVRDLLFGRDGAFMFPLGLFRHFPALRTLAVDGDTCLGAEAIGDAEREVAMPQLETFEMHVMQCDHLALFSVVPRLSSIARIKYDEPHADIVCYLLDHLHGPLEIEIAGPGVWGDDIEISFSMMNTNRSRDFAGEAESIQSGWLRDIVLAPELVERVTALFCSSSVAYLVPLFGELTACTTLTLEVNGVADLSAPSGLTFALPALKSIVARSYPELGPVYISAEALHDFLARVIGARSEKPELSIDKPLTLTGDNTALKQDFGFSGA